MGYEYINIYMCVYSSLLAHSTVLVVSVTFRLECGGCAVCALIWGGYD